MDRQPADRSRDAGVDRDERRRPDGPARRRSSIACARRRARVGDAVQSGHAGRLGDTRGCGRPAAARNLVRSAGLRRGRRAGRPDRVGSHASRRRAGDDDPDVAGDRVRPARARFPCRRLQGRVPVL